MVNKKDQSTIPDIWIVMSCMFRWILFQTFVTVAKMTLHKWAQYSRVTNLMTEQQSLDFTQLFNFFSGNTWHIEDKVHSTEVDLWLSVRPKKDSREHTERLLGDCFLRRIQYFILRIWAMTSWIYCLAVVLGMTKESITEVITNHPAG